MLRKLIKHEFRAVNRLMIPLHLGLILITVIGRFYVQFAMNNPALTNYSYALNIWESLINATLVVFYFIALMAISILTSVYMSIIRPRKNLFTDEGYLMHTLPVSAASHIWSKLIVAFTWCAIDILLVILSLFAMFVNIDFLRDMGKFLVEMVKAFPDAFGVPAAIGLPMFLLAGIIDLIKGILVVYACIAIGHSFNNHKILSSVGLYVGYTFVINMLSTIIAALTGLATNSRNISGLFIAVSSYTTYANPGTYFWLSMIVDFILSAGICAAAFLLTNYFMSRRLNLE